MKQNLFSRHSLINFTPTSHDVNSFRSFLLIKAVTEFFKISEEKRTFINALLIRIDLIEQYYRVRKLPDEDEFSFRKIKGKIKSDLWIFELINNSWFIVQIVDLIWFELTSKQDLTKQFYRNSSNVFTKDSNLVNSNCLKKILDYDYFKKIRDLCSGHPYLTRDGVFKKDIACFFINFDEKK